MVTSKRAVYILTHGRPHNQRTLAALDRQGWTGRTILFLDNEDDTVDEYRRAHPNRELVVFDKAEVESRIDLADLGTDRRTITHARCAAIEHARSIGLTHLLQLDDDYPYFAHRWLRPGVASAPIRQVENLDEAFDRMWQFLDDTGADCVALAQGGDHLGGGRGSLPYHVKRKAMNSMFLRADTRVWYHGRMNEDVNTYVMLGSRGYLFLTPMRLMLQHLPSQQQEGGISGLYASTGTYVKSFYTVMHHPSSVRVEMMRSHHARAHHKINFRRTVPMIVSDRHRKPRAGVKSPS